MAAPGPGEGSFEQIVANEVIRLVARRHGRQVTPTAADRFEADLGLTSVDRVELLLSVETMLGVSLEPPATPTVMQTVGELLTACGLALGRTARPAATDPALLASRDRAEARRRRRVP